MKKFTVSGYKGIREVELTPTGNLTVIAGGNGAGKSSFIDAITELFDPRGTKLTPKPIRDGETEARAEFVDDELGIRITRVWRKDGTPGTLAAEALDGAQYKRPADVVAKLTGGSIFDPLAWLNMDEKKQREELLEKVDLPFDLAKLTTEKAAAENDRLEAGREVKRLKSVVDSKPQHGDDVPDEEVSSSELIDLISAAQSILETRAKAEREVSQTATRIAQLRQEVARLEREIEQQEAWNKEALAYLSSIVGDPAEDMESLKQQLAHSEDLNRKVREKADWERAVAANAEASATHADAQKRLDTIEQKKRDGLTAATFPLPGLSVDEDGITFDGIPFSQVNSAHRMRAAFGIAAAGDPDLKLVIVKNGDLLDADSLDALAQLAEERGYTALVERDRDQSRSIGFVIRDGELANA